MLPLRFFCRIPFVFQKLLTVLLLLLFGCSNKEKKLPKPKLVVSIVVDQMRYDYLGRFQTYFKNRGGFSRLLEGYNFTETRFSYVPTFTAPGHATIFTGTTPKYHGIVGNDWYSRSDNKMVYCAEDLGVNGIGVIDANAGQMSPKRLLKPSLGDHFKAEFGEESKVYGVSIKDRGAIFPAGLRPNAAYWFLGKEYGKWITSSYYEDSLPKWIQNFNESGYADSLLHSTWQPDALLEQLPDTTPFERPLNGMVQAVFPYHFKELSEENNFFDLLRKSPAGNEILSQFTKDLIGNEALGQDDICDFLSISYSSTDYVGHQFGTESKELADTYIKLDKNLADLFRYLDKTVGKGAYVVMLTADHGAAPPPSYSSSRMNQGGALDKKQLRRDLNEACAEITGLDNAIIAMVNQQLYLNPEIDTTLQKKIKEFIVSFLQKADYIEEVWSTEALGKGVDSQYSGNAYNPARAGFLPERCGDIWYFLKPYWVEYYDRGSDHGSYVEYDIHVPFLLYQEGMNPKEINKACAVKDIAPTVIEYLDMSPLGTASGQSQFYKADSN